MASTVYQSKREGIGFTFDMHLHLFAHAGLVSEICV